MEINTKANTKVAKKMDKLFILMVKIVNGQDINMKGNTKMVKEKDMVLLRMELKVNT